MSYFRGLVHGTVIGTAIGICIAPQTGKKSRQQISDAAAKVQRTAQKAQETAQKVAPQFQTVAVNVKHQVDKVRNGDSEVIITANGNGSLDT